MKAILKALVFALIFTPQVMAQNLQLFLPAGPYQNSCRECVKKAHLLSCLCEKIDGSLQISELDCESCIHEIINDNGVLKSSPRSDGKTTLYIALGNLGAFVCGGFIYLLLKARVKELEVRQ